MQNGKPSRSSTRCSTRGVTVDIVDLERGAYELRLVMDASAPADCMVPDPTLISIATDALQRRGTTVSSMSVLRRLTEATG